MSASDADDASDGKAGRALSADNDGRWRGRRGVLGAHAPSARSSSACRLADECAGAGTDDSGTGAGDDRAGVTGGRNGLVGEGADGVPATLCRRDGPLADRGVAGADISPGVGPASGCR